MQLGAAVRLAPRDGRDLLLLLGRRTTLATGRSPSSGARSLMVAQVYSKPTTEVGVKRLAK